MQIVPIGQAARLSGVKVTTIRFYEERGLLPKATRSEGNRRHYGPDDIARLQFIRHSRNLGFGLEDITALLSLSDKPDQDCAAVDAIAKAQMAKVDRRIEQLATLRAELARMVSACTHGTVADCGVIACLADHGLCQSDHAAAPAQTVMGD